MKLYGSTTSPYVRRIRILLANIEHEFVHFNIFGTEREAIKETNPTLKVPVFEDEIDGQVQQIFDSGNVFRYLSDKLKLEPLSIAEQNQLSIIDACCDSLVNMMILKRSSVDISKDKLYFNIQRERQTATFDYIETALSQGAFSDWRYPSICLLATVEWAKFRSLFDFNGYPQILAFIERHQTRDDVKSTAPKE